MSQPARSMLAWTAYVTLVGAGLMLVPNTILGLFQIEETEESWVRLVGVIVLVLAIIYAFMVREESRAMFAASVYGRWWAVVGMTVLALTAGPWQLILFAAADLIGSSWTFLALRAEPTAPTA